MRRRTAFAFVELLVDLALVALMVGCMIPYYIFTQKTISLRIARREMSILKVAVNSYYEHRDPHAYPPPMDTICAALLLKVRPQVVKNVFYDPFSRPKREYHYATSPNGKHYCIWTVGRNRVSEIRGIYDAGNVIRNKRCDDLFATRSADPVLPAGV